MTLGTLREELLYVVVFGPCFGESIAVRVPKEAGSAAWMVVDSCRMPGVIPALELMKAREAHGEVLEAVVISHPHADHIGGMEELLAYAPTDCEVYMVDVPVSCLKVTAQKVYKRVNVIWSTGVKHDLRAGTEFLVGMRLECAALWPHQSRVDSLNGRSNEQIDWNAVSVPLWLRWGDKDDRRGCFKALLGADLEHNDWSQVSRTVWREVGHDFAVHSLLKVPHHGSTIAGSAQHVSEVWAGGEECVAREWVLTPYNRSPLPRADESAGLGLLLRYVPEVAMTSLPLNAKVLRAAQLDHAPGYVERRELEQILIHKDASARVMESYGARGGELTLALPAAPPAPQTTAGVPMVASVERSLDGGLEELVEVAAPARWARHYVAYGFDERGRLCDRRYGPGSIVVVP